MPLAPELIVLLRGISQNPLIRLPEDQEKQLVGLGLIRRWQDFVALTDAGRAALEQSDKSDSGPSS